MAQTIVVTGHVTAFDHSGSAHLRRAARVDGPVLRGPAAGGDVLLLARRGARRGCRTACAGPNRSGVQGHDPTARSSSASGSCTPPGADRRSSSTSTPRSSGAPRWSIPRPTTATTACAHGPIASRSAWKSVTVVLDELREVDGCVVASGRISAFDHRGDQVVDSVITCVAEFRDGRVVRAASFFSDDDALAWVSARPALP